MKNTKIILYRNVHKIMDKILIMDLKEKVSNL